MTRFVVPTVTQAIALTLARCALALRRLHRPFALIALAPRLFLGTLPVTVLPDDFFCLALESVQVLCREAKLPLDIVAAAIGKEAGRALGERRASARFERSPGLAGLQEHRLCLCRINDALRWRQIGQDLCKRLRLSGP